MRFLLRILVFAAGFLIGGEALRRWLEREEAAAPAAGAPHLRAVPEPERPRSKAELYERAKALDIDGRSKMSKSELAEAVARAEARA